MYTSIISLRKVLCNDIYKYFEKKYIFYRNGREYPNNKKVQMKFNGNIISSFILFNGKLDVIMVISHTLTGYSWWSQYDIVNEYLYFSLLYGSIRIFQNSRTLVSISYFLETIYFYYEKDSPYTSFVCLVLSVLTAL